MSPYFCLSDFFNDTPPPIQKLGHIPPLVFTQFSMWRNPLHFRVIEGHPCLSPSPPTTNTQSCYLWMLGTSPKEGMLRDL